MHDAQCLQNASALLKQAQSHSAMADLVRAAVARNEQWRGQQCINLVAAESPTSPSVRALLSSEVGIRASGGHIGRDNRFFSGMKNIDELESLCVELLKMTFDARYADHRLMGGMAAVLAAYTALTRPEDNIMTVPVIRGGDTSNRTNGPPGVRGLKIWDIPFIHKTSEVDLNRFSEIAQELKPAVIGLGMTLTLFALPINDIKGIVSPWGGKVYFDAAHQLGLISSGLFQNPLKEGADLMTGSSGKTFSGPQGGIIAWNDPDLTAPINTAIFPTLTGSHQINRVAALAVAATEMLEFGTAYMTQVVRNAQALAKSLDNLGVTAFYREQGYTQTHQIVIDSKPFECGRDAVQRLEAANIIANEMPLPWDIDPHRESGIRLGTIEVTRLGMKEMEMEWIAEKIAKVLLHREDPMAVANSVIDFMKNYRTVYYCHEHGLPQ
ncbi:serine hydroxymethyltransferase [Pseudomonas orientalis]|uniref:Glycine hydroxymethyltransferase n=1 Tax=Pseudomonas orientalis TaxID=76758 RepID=A0A1H2FKC6_9PSED|nr:serine hydroxymethyltransferase [Pseudomonas orientalis]KRP65067.1 serine hydroxymethyltransferase [Pseudomonas orientalis]SDU07765.1 glycine hydroxymethyltransferase [Pseudomonas orientalis]